MLVFFFLFADVLSEAAPYGVEEDIGALRASEERHCNWRVVEGAFLGGYAGGVEEVMLSLSQAMELCVDLGGACAWQRWRQRESSCPKMMNRRVM